MTLPRIVAEGFDNVIGRFNGGSMIASATGNQTMNASAIITSAIGLEDEKKAISSSTSTPSGYLEATKSTNYFGMKHLRGYGAILGYFQSRWALGTFVIVSKILPIICTSLKYSYCCRALHILLISSRGHHVAFSMTSVFVTCIRLVRKAIIIFYYHYVVRSFFQISNSSLFPTLRSD